MSWVDEFDEEDGGKARSCDEVFISFGVPDETNPILVASSVSIYCDGGGCC